MRSMKKNNPAQIVITTIDVTKINFAFKLRLEYQLMSEFLFIVSNSEGSRLQPMHQKRCHRPTSPELRYPQNFLWRFPTTGCFNSPQSRTRNVSRIDELKLGTC